MGSDDTGARRRRRYERSPVALLVQYRFNTFEDFVAEYATDLSPGGIFIRTGEAAQPGALIHLQFSLKDGSKLVEALGRVVHVQPEGMGSPAGIGVELIQVDEETRALIQRICAERPGPKSGRT